MLIRPRNTKMYSSCALACQAKTGKHGIEAIGAKVQQTVQTIEILYAKYFDNYACMTRSLPCLHTMLLRMLQTVLQQRRLTKQEQRGREQAVKISSIFLNIIKKH